jgi:lambda family phage tail tape measure protein
MMVLIFGGLPAVFAEKFNAAFGGVVKAVEWVINKLIDGVNHVLKAASLVRAIVNRNEIDSKRQEAKALQDASFKLGMNASDPAPDYSKMPRDQIDAAHAAWSQRQAQRKAVMDANNARAAQLNQEADRLAGNLPALPQIELDREGVKGAGAAMAQGLKDNLDAIKTEVVSELEKYEAEVQRIGLARSKVDPGKINDDKGRDRTKPQTDKDGAAKMMRELEALMKKSNAILEAEMQLERASEVLTWGIDNGKISAEKAIEVYLDYATVLREQHYPYATFIEDIDKATAAMKGSHEEADIHNQLIEARTKLIEAGHRVNEMEMEVIEAKLVLQQEQARIWEKEKQILQEVNGKYREHIDYVKALIKLRQEGKLTHEEKQGLFTAANNNLTSSNDAAYEAFRKKQFASTPMFGNDTNDYTRGEIYTGIQAGLKAIEKDATNVSGAISDVMTTAFGNVEEFILKSVENGQLAWDSLIDGMLNALNRLALKLIETWIIMKAMNLASGNAPAATLAGTPGAGTIIDPAAWGGGFAEGGSYVVPGSGAPDSRKVLFRVSPGERIDFTPPGKASQSGGGGAARSGSGKVSVYNVHDRRSLLQELDTPEGHTVIHNVLRKNPGFRG